MKCACGCKTNINPIDKKGRPRRFVSGHNGKRFFTVEDAYKKGIRSVNQGYLFFIFERKRVYLHRYHMELKLGRKLKKNEIVHHLDHNRLNNLHENLELIGSISDHQKLHDKTRKKNLKGRYC